MKIGRIFLILSFTLLVIGMDGCKKAPSSSKKNTKKIKKGKPIPCPIKDC